MGRTELNNILPLMAKTKVIIYGIDSAGKKIIYTPLFKGPADKVPYSMGDKDAYRIKVGLRSVAFSL